MQIQHKQTDSKGSFYIKDEDSLLAEMVYNLSSDKMIIEHTEVDEQLRGQNIGYELVQHAVLYARKHNLKIVPICPFAKAVFDKKPDFQDVLI